jgi:adenosylhomocysteine nucleosidase
MSAFGSELSLVLEEMAAQGDIHVEVVNGRSVHIGQLYGLPVLATLSGVSMINAASQTTALFERFEISRLVYTGIAGGVNPVLRIGDVSIASEVREYQEMRFCRELDPGMYDCEGDDNFGMMFPRPGPCTMSPDFPVDECQRVPWYQVDAEMLAVAEEVSTEVVLNRCGLDRDGNEVCLSHQPQIVVGGRGVAGQTFVDNPDFREWTWEVMEADYLDMETAAVGHVCYIYGAKCLFFRSLSDLAGGGPGQNEIGIWFRIAATNAAMVDLAWIEEWAETHDN